MILYHIHQLSDSTQSLVVVVINRVRSNFKVFMRNNQLLKHFVINCITHRHYLCVLVADIYIAVVTLFKLFMSLECKYNTAVCLQESAPLR